MRALLMLLALVLAACLLLAGCVSGNYDTGRAVQNVSQSPVQQPGEGEPVSAGAVQVTLYDALLKLFG